MNGVERTSVVELYKVLKGVDRDDDINDELTHAQNELQSLKTSISELSKQNYIFEQDVQYLDARIALIIQNKINSEETSEMVSRLQEKGSVNESILTDDEKKGYGNLFCALQSEPQHIAKLCQRVGMNEIDNLLQTVMFSIYGNQFDAREEHLLLVMFQQVISSQFEQATDSSSLLRANTPVSRMMTAYTRRGPGQAYLQDVISAPLAEIIEYRGELDVNPIRAFNKLKVDNPNDPGYQVNFKLLDARSHPRFADLQDLLEPRFTNLRYFVSHLLDVMISNVDKIPYGIRWMAKQVRLLAQSRFPDSTMSQLSSLLGGYFFLRFITPAIVTPQAYMLIDQAPHDLARRNLTMIAKCVQLIANQSSGSKEMFTVQVYGYCKEEDSRVQQFLYSICDVPDFYDSLELDQYLSLTTQERALKITYQEIHSMHALLLKYPPSDRIQQLLDALGPLPEKKSRANTRGEIELPINLRTQAMVFGEESGSEELRNNISFLEAKTLLVNIRRAYPSLPPEISPTNLAQYAADSPNKQLKDRGIRAQVMLLTSMDSSDANMKLLQEEVNTEVSRLGSLTNALKVEASSLRNVFITVREHNEYLESQLNTFRSYLNNIRTHIVPETTKKANNGTPQPQVFSCDELFSMGILKRWPYGRAMSNQLNIKFTPHNNRGQYTLAMIHQSRPNQPLLQVYFTVDDLLERRENNKDVDLKCFRMAPVPLLELLPNI